ncbi:unnamed protein product, partial [Rotaria magnacalcarata]
APLGHVCPTLGVSYLIVRSGSNITQEAPNDDYLLFSRIAALEASKFLLHFIHCLDTTVETYICNNVEWSVIQ